MKIPTVKLVRVTPEAEQHIAYCARVSNPKNQDSGSIEGLLKGKKAFNRTLILCFQLWR